MCTIYFTNTFYMGFYALCADCRPPYTEEGSVKHKAVAHLHWQVK